MNTPLKDVRTICKTILRNGWDAYPINPELQVRLAGDEITEVDIACEPDFEELARMFNTIERMDENGVIAKLQENGVTYYFYKTDTEEASVPEKTLMRVSTRMLRQMYQKGLLPHRLAGPDIDSSASTYSIYDDFEDIASGFIALRGLPDLTLRGNYLLAIRAMRLAANLQLPIAPATWIAIVRGAGRVLDYVPAHEFLSEWQAVEAERMWNFVKLLYESFTLHGILPEVAALSRISYVRPDGQTEDLLEHAIGCMRCYPEGDYKDDWLGTFVMLFHEVGKLYTADWFNGSWTFFQHHRVGAKVARKLLRRLRLPDEQIETVCHLVRHHIRFQAMLTDRGIRRFKALEEYPRLIEMARAKIHASGDSSTNFNHNMKYLARAEVPETMVEPLLNGNEIMDFTGLAPGPQVGVIREALLAAQVAGVVNAIPEAVDFVLNFKRKHFG